MWNPDQYLEKLYQENKPSLAFTAENREQWQSWREELKEAFLRDLGGFPENKPSLAPRVLEETDCGEYIRQRIVYTSEEALEVPAYLLLPRSSQKKLPAVVACHGHGYGSREIVGLNPDGSPNTGDPGYQKNFAVELAKRGFIVIAPDLLGFGDRRLEEDRNKPMQQSSCHRISTYLLMMGKTISGVRVHDTIRAIDYLLSREDVDAERIGCMGISGGGLVAAFLGALDERVKAAVVSGYTNTFKASVMGVFHCVDNFIPGIVGHGEMPDLISLIAPRALLIESGTQDDIFPVQATREAYEKIKKAYQLLQVEERLDIDIFEGDHQISGKKAYGWLLKWL